MQVKYISHMGDDVQIVDAARVSFSKKSKGYEITDHVLGTKKLSDADTSLIQFLARGCTSGDWRDYLDKVEDRGFTAGYHADKFARRDLEELVSYIRGMPTHWTPFGHTALTLHFKAPIFVARQLGKHQVGLVWNEVSRRYVSDPPDFHFPEEWRSKADNVKQGSSDEASPFTDDADHNYSMLLKDAANLYDWMISKGICAEQARMVLPQSMETEWYWTGNLYSFANIYIQRSDSHAQKEVQEIAKQIKEIVEPLFPVSFKALTS